MKLYINKTRIKIILNKHIEHLMKEKKNKEEIIKMKMTYKQQISKLEEMEKEYKDKFFSNEKKKKKKKEKEKEKVKEEK